jgi:hypothetical protein
MFSVPPESDCLTCSACSFAASAARLVSTRLPRPSVTALARVLEKVLWNSTAFWLAPRVASDSPTTTAAASIAVSMLAAAAGVATPPPRAEGMPPMAAALARVCWPPLTEVVSDTLCEPDEIRLRPL